MIPNHKRRITRSFRVTLFCLFLLTIFPISSAQQTPVSKLSSFVKDLKDKDAKVRAEAVRGLISMRASAKPAIPALVEALGDSDPKVRYRAVIALGNLWSGIESGAEIEAAVPALLKLLKDEDPYTRRRALHAFGQIGPGAQAALPTLKQIMHDRNDPDWVLAFSIVNDIERPPTDDVSTLAGLLKDKDATIRAQAAERLELLGMRAMFLSGNFKADEAIPALIAALKDPETKVRYYSLITLGHFGYNLERPDLGAIIPTVTELLKDADRGIRWNAAVMLGKLGPRSRAAIPLLTQALNDDDDTVRGYAADALGEIGPESKVAAPALIKLLKDRDAHVRGAAAGALAKVDPGSAPVVVAALSDDLKNEKPEFWGSAAYALGNFGQQAKPAVPLLVNLLKAEDTSRCETVVNTLAKIGPSAREAASALRSLLNHRVRSTRRCAAIALLKIVPESEAGIPPDLLYEAKLKIAQNEAEANSGNKTFPGVARPDPGTDWDEAMDLMSRGLQFYRQGDLNAAVASFTEAIEIDPRYADAYHSRGQIHRQRGNYDAAIADFSMAIETDNRSTVSHYFARGMTYVSRRDYTAAIADFTQIINQDNYNAEAYYARGLAYHYKGNLDAAVADYDRAIIIVPPVAKAFGARGTIKLTQGKIADAYVDFHKGIKVDPQNAYNYEGLGEVEARFGNKEQAREAWAIALSLATDEQTKARINKRLSALGKQ